MILKIEVRGQAATTYIAGLEELLDQPAPLFTVWGQAVVKVLKGHFRALDKSNPNKYGGKRSHFWAKIGDSVQQPKIGQATISVSINDPAIRQKFFGGVIIPKEKKWLAIPNTKLVREAYDKRPAVYEEKTGNKLRFVKYSDYSAALLEQLTQNGEKGGKKWRKVYSLKRAVIQDNMDGALPEDSDYYGPMNEASNDLFASLQP